MGNEWGEDLARVYEELGTFVYLKFEELPQFTLVEIGDWGRNMNFDLSDFEVEKDLYLDVCVINRKIIRKHQM